MDRVQRPVNLGVGMLGFGEYPPKVQCLKLGAAKKAHRIAIVLFSAGAVASAGLIATASIVVVPVLKVVVLVGGVVGFVSLSALAIRSVIRLWAMKYWVPCTSILGLDAKERGSTPLGVFSHGHAGMVFADGAEAMRWKFKLIEEAKSNIVISGSYCGGHVFDALLERLEARLEENDRLRVYILSADTFVTAKNRKSLKELQEAYPERFHIVETPMVLNAVSGIKISTNHTKAVSIDNGKYILIGGSGIEDKYNHDGLSRVRQRGTAKSGGVGRFIAKQFRDMDFLVCSDAADGVGKTIHLELLKLYALWKQQSFPSRRGRERFQDLFCELAENEKADIRELDREENVFQDASVKAFATGPENRENPFEKELIRRIRHAKKSICIDHLYFHPTPPVLLALRKAAARDVEITIVTNKDGKNSPRSHMFFVDKSRHYCCRLSRGKGRDNVRLYEFSVKDTTLHKKVVVIDDEYVITGNGNIGYKSLATMSDYELHLVIRSRECARETMRVIQSDRHHAKRVSGKKLRRLRLKVECNALWQRCLGPVAG